MKRNPAIARRYAGRSWTPAHLDGRRSHFADAVTRDAQRAVAEALEGRSTPLGTGNFGATFLVTLNGTPLVVKFGSRKTIHTRRPSDMYEWTQKEWSQGGRSLKVAAENMIHEAGIANELWAMGRRVVPQTVYAEHKGRPALVREYGQIPANVTPGEFDALSLALGDVVEAGFAVKDDLLVARRPSDGSLFIADVGFWRPFDPRDADTLADAQESLTFLLDKFSRSLPWSNGNVVPSAYEAALASAKLDRAVQRYGKRTDFLAKTNLRHATESMQRIRDQRAAVGLPT